MSTDFNKPWWLANEIEDKDTGGDDPDPEPDDPPQRQ